MYVPSDITSLFFWGELPQTILGGWIILLDYNNIFVFKYLTII